MNARSVLVLTVLLGGVGVVFAQGRVEWFADQRYGMFIHWGPSVIHGGRYASSELSWSRGGNPPDAWHSGGAIPERIYDESYLSFCPTAYDPGRWVALARQAGMRYLVLTARHHDGFSMFDTEYSEFKITNPAGAYRQWIARENPDWSAEAIDRRADIVGRFAEAVHEAGLGLGIYYSEPDWIREDYRIALTGKDAAGREVSPEERLAAKAGYQDFMHAQLEELTTNYGRVDVLWLDAIKPSQVAEHGWEALWIREGTLGMVRRNQPGILVNDRHGLEADYRTPEGSDATYVAGVVQESCQHMGRQWAWWPGDEARSAKWIVERVVINASRGSNVLMNVGPSPAGVMDSLQAQRLREAGQWLESHAEAVYGTRGGPVVENSREPRFVTTQREGKAYVHLLRSEAGGRVELPGVVIEAAYRYGRPGEKVAFGAGWIEWPDECDAIDEVIVVETGR